MDKQPELGVGLHMAITKKPETISYDYSWCCIKLAGAKEKSMIRVGPDGTVELYNKKGKLVDPDMSRCPFCKTAISISQN